MKSIAGPLYQEIKDVYMDLNRQSIRRLGYKTLTSRLDIDAIQRKVIK